MKKLVLMLSVCFAFAVVSCKETDKKMDAETDTEMHEDHAADQADMAMAAEYQCPMDCEEGKTYDKAGICPVCEMELKTVEVAEAGSEEEAHEHSH